MITEQERVVEARNDLLNEIKVLETRIKKSECYERLKDNEDFKAVLEDMKGLIVNHENQIKGGLHELADMGCHKLEIREKWTNFIIEHTIEMELLQQGVGAVDHIIHLAQQAREQLPELREKLEDIKLIKTDEEPTHA